MRCTEDQLTPEDLTELAEKLRERSVDWQGPLPTPCRIWLRGVTSDGYGELYLRGRKWRAHRLAYLIANGRSAEPLCCHRCDEPGCINPDHLFPGDDQINSDDKWVKGRGLRGERHGSAKLSEAEVIEIKRLITGGEMSRAEIGNRFGVDRSAVRKIARGRSWRHVLATEEAA